MIYINCCFISIDQYVYVGSVLALMNPAFPHSNNDYLSGLQTYGCEEFYLRH